MHILWAEVRTPSIVKIEFLRTGIISANLERQQVYNLQKKGFEPQEFQTPAGLTFGPRRERGFVWGTW